MAKGLLQLWQLAWRWPGLHWNPFRSSMHSLQVMVECYISMSLISTSESVEALMSELRNRLFFLLLLRVFLVYFLLYFFDYFL